MKQYVGESEMKRWRRSKNVCHETHFGFEIFEIRKNLEVSTKQANVLQMARLKDMCKISISTFFFKI